MFASPLTTRILFSRSSRVSWIRRSSRARLGLFDEEVVIELRIYVEGLGRRSAQESVRTFFRFRKLVPEGRFIWLLAAEINVPGASERINVMSREVVLVLITLT